MSSKWKKASYAEGNLRNLIAEDRFYNCIAHHTIITIPETKLEKKVHTCQKVTPQMVKLHKHLGEMYEAGILDHLLARQSDEINYRLTPAAQRAFKKIFISYQPPIKHPKISKEERKLILLNAS